MKKSVLHLFLAAMVAGASLASCSNEEPVAPETEIASVSSKSSTLSPEQAVDIAAQVHGIFRPNQVSSRSTDFSVMPITKHASRSAASDTLMYVVGYGEGEGFSVISASTETPPILGYIESGNYYDIETVENPGFSLFMNAAASYVDATKTASDFNASFNPGLLPAFREWTVHYHDSIPARLDVQWGQDYPEGVFCPNKVSGCVQTALAQVFSYFEYPKSINLTYLDNRNLSLNWEQIKMHKQSEYYENPEFYSLHSYHCPATSETHETLSHLLRELGHRNNALYLFGDSSKYNKTLAKISASRATAFNLIPTDQLSVSFINSYSSTMNLINHLADGGLIIMRGETDNGDGHEWVADGGIRIGRIEYRTSYATDLDGNPVTTKKEYLDLLIHFNWGWNGNCNGYFEPEVFNVDAAKYSDIPTYQEDGDEPVIFSNKLQFYCISPYQKLQK